MTYRSRVRPVAILKAGSLGNLENIKRAKILFGYLTPKKYYNFNQLSIFETDESMNDPLCIPTVLGAIGSRRSPLRNLGKRIPPRPLE